jgi:hypothetical protein
MCWVTECGGLDMAATFAERLRQLRERAGLTQEQLVQASGVNIWTIRGYEQGRREPNVKRWGTVGGPWSSCGRMRLGMGWARG